MVQQPPQPVPDVASRRETTKPKFSGREGRWQTAEQTPIHDDAATLRARLRDREADLKFVAALAPTLDYAARERARRVRMRPDPPAGLLIRVD